MNKLLVTLVLSISVMGSAWAEESSGFRAFAEENIPEMKTAGGAFLTNGTLWSAHAGRELEKAFGGLQRSVGATRTPMNKIAKTITAASLLSGYYGGIYLTGDGLHDLDQKYTHGEVGKALRGRINGDVSVTEAKQKLMPAEAMQMGDVPGSPYAVTWMAH